MPNNIELIVTLWVLSTISSLVPTITLDLVLLRLSWYQTKHGMHGAVFYLTTDHENQVNTNEGAKLCTLEALNIPYFLIDNSKFKKH